ncbi:MAG: acetyl-CoA carboxylase biotin carboxylase subunit [Ignavibacteria bacterium GWB2_35_12]|nr:MAG: acetyl-CoA carboxylase biotin carboxylase subunit [Ignavibacteria bacterium GWA2_35_8]OGU39282.1 MAG: acetyl-CoA carboxylase biotin carboxylase subunit [Ignavibacteria bacterium GWB2_35_12]OGU89478.1 MAG: acetyl-CoA carboxylase biotin carboxylase subunit [Ignavibacteria bacterium RIFOXYA2_FULL_35_10]OGV21164.1 MAG: acetyl-CoA carboxylase biotin carboxylase subunit [Ignavibacteria bacterium RIFOXYC2_FULL_35_21]
MIKKILVANRSEIACRIIRSCKEMGIKTVAVYSEADSKALHTQLADESICIGPPPALQSYLNMEGVIKAAKDTGCDAIHPGYGFLAENSDFNKKVRDAGLIFIGPEPEPMKLLGSKVMSRVTMIDAGIPVIPGMKSSSKDINEFEKTANEMGFPVLIKASAGGGGKGMRVVKKIEELKTAVESAMRESQSAFGSDEVYLEKYIESPRHVEFQVAADNFGNVVYLFERECSIQRRHQKIIEETPSPIMDAELQKKMGETAVKVIKTANYNNLGTVEFLVDKDKNFYFLEVNARIQVEHPITEMTTGIDLVKLQVQIASGEKLPFKQKDLKQTGHAIECRIYAEDPDNNFMPSSGKILFLKVPMSPGVRYDSGIYQGAEIPVFYDPVLAKLIVWAPTREEARNKMLIALKENVILGVKTSIGFMAKCLEHEEFIKGNTFTDFIAQNMKIGTEYNSGILNKALIGAALFDNQKKKTTNNNVSVSSEMSSPWQTIGYWEICTGSTK